MLTGGGGNDSILGRDGDDTLAGGAGADTLDGGAQNDTADYAASAAAVIVDLGAASQSGGDAQGDVLTGIENVSGSALADSLTGDASANALTGGGGNDSLYGGDGNDLLDGGDGLDQLTGGAGDDRYLVRGHETLIEAAGNDTLVASDGNDQLSGGTGSDLMQGGNGNDIYFVDSSGDSVDEATGSGTADEVRTTISLTLGADLEIPRLQGTAISGTGNTLDNDLIGNGTGNALDGLDGADKLYGYGGADTLQGGAGTDSLYGGGAADQLYGGADRDILRGDVGNDVFWFADGDYAGTTNPSADRIVDFTQGSDRINLSLTDAVAGGADNAFSFIGSAAFTGVAGQLRYAQSAGVTLILGDTNGDSLADIGIALTGTINLLAGDFVL